jgi:2-aminoethylphosphonate transport system ATP-binding protein
MSEAVAGADALTGAAAVPAAHAASGIGFDGVTVAYRRTVVLKALTLTIEPGEIMAIIGPSGSGKTTALRAVAGFVRPVAGRIRIGDTDVTDLPPYARDLGMVVQNYALFPHMRVDENVAFGLRARRAPEALITTQVQECLRMVGMADFIHRYPRELSGGQQQRVAIARALAIRPRVLLLDEPLSALDAQIRRSMLGELARLHRELPTLTVLYVTHDQTEALTLADRIAIMRDGELVAHGLSQMLYREPPNRFAAEFLGRANLLPVRLEGGPQEHNLAHVRFGEVPLTATAPRDPLPIGPCLLCVRPHALRLGRTGDGNELTARVRDVQWQGDLHAIDLEVMGHGIRAVCTPLREPPQPGDEVTLGFSADDATLIPHDDHV